MAGKEDEWRTISSYWRPVHHRKYRQNLFSYNSTKKYRGYQYKHFKNFSQPIYPNYGRGKDYLTSKDKFGSNNPSHSNRKVPNKIVKKSKDVTPWSEEAQEETRKKELSEAANRLMKKLRVWNLEKNGEQNKSEDDHREKSYSERDSSQETNNLQTIQFEEELPETCSLKSLGRKSKISSQLEMAVGNVKSEERMKLGCKDKEMNNKASKKKNFNEVGCKNMSSHQRICSRAENKQKKIHKYLISELMTMPKNNLKQVLINPKVHPKIELGMAQIVKENRLSLAQKLRNLAETKINNCGQLVCSQFINDIGSLIDADFAVDVCQLPPELIKQIGDIFQLDFDNSMCSSDKKSSIDMNRESVIEESNNHNCPNESILCGISVEEFRSSAVVSQEKLNIKTEPNDPDFSNNVIKEQNHNYDSDCLSEFCQEFVNNCEESLQQFCCSSHSKSTVISKSDEVEMKFMPDYWSETGESECFSETNCVNNSFHRLKENEHVGSNCMIVDNMACTDNHNPNVDNNKEIGTESHIMRTVSRFEGNKYPKFDANNRIAHNVRDKNSITPPMKTSCDESIVGTYHLKNVFTDRSTSVQRRNTPKEKSVEGIVGNENILNDTAEVRVANEPETITFRTSTLEVLETQDSKHRKSVDTEIRRSNNAEAQTEIKLIDWEFSQCSEILRECEDREESLIAEVKLIDNLLHQLNQRRFFLFLKLVGLTSCHSKQNDLKALLMQTVTNGDPELLSNVSKDILEKNKLYNQNMFLTESQKSRKRKHAEDFASQNFCGKKQNTKANSYKSDRKL